MEFVENDVVTIIIWFPCPSFPPSQIQNPKWLVNCDLKFLWHGVVSLAAIIDDEHLMHFQSKTSDFEFLWGQGLSYIYMQR